MCKRLSIFLGLILLFGQFSFALPAPAPDSSVVLSQAEADSVYSALEQAKEALRKPSEEIKKQSRQLTTLSIFCGGLVVIDLGVTGLAVYECGRASGWWK